MKNKKIIITVGVFLLTIVLVVVGGIIAFNQTNKTYEITNRQKEFKNAKSLNEDTVGWIKILGTNIDYPVNLGNKVNSENELDTIWTNDTLDEKDRIKNRQMILGHNVLNVTSKPLINGKGHTRFEPLMGYVYESFTEEHLYFQYTNEYGETSMYKVYAVSFYKTDEDNGEYYETEADLKNYIDKVKTNSIYDFDVEVLPTDRLVTLATCTRYNGIDGSTHFKVDARKVRENEKNNKYSFKTNKNYDIIEESRK